MSPGFFVPRNILLYQKGVTQRVRRKGTYPTAADPKDPGTGRTACLWLDLPDLPGWKADTTGEK